MRTDNVGFFWADAFEVKTKKEGKAKPIKVIPEKVWLNDDYLPGLAQAKAMPGMKFLNNEELIQLRASGDKMLFDIECYPNYFLASFRSYLTGKAIYFELGGDKDFDPDLVKWILANFTIVGFNSLNYDLPIVSLAIAGKSMEKLKQATDDIILRGMRRHEIMRNYRTKLVQCDMIDLMGLTPLAPSLKTCSGRLHTPKMQDLPFEPSKILNDDQKAIVRWYNLNGDLTATGFLYHRLKSHIELREAMSADYGMDLRSKSDPQIAETIIGAEYTKITGERPTRSEVSIGAIHQYIPPAFIQFQSPLLQWALKIVTESEYIIDDKGRIGLPKAVKALKLEINGSIYRMGIGGLHSSEKSSCHVATDLIGYHDLDVTSYYPRTILNSGLFPSNLGPIFLRIYDGVVVKRVHAKEAHIKVTANGLKIVINGTFGKMGSKYSIIYAPALLIHVTLTGQLSLLMLIEAYELVGLHVISANTDGIIVECSKSQIPLMTEVKAWWERVTGYETEETSYKAVYSRDVNNYIAVKTNGDAKCKGVFYNPFLDEDPRKALEHNPSNTICSDAVVAYLTKGIPLKDTIEGCKDITAFLTVRRAKGGAVKIWEDGRIEYLGKAVRWYYSTEVKGAIIGAESGDRVANTEDSRPVMDLPQGFPEDVDIARYIQESSEMLTDLGL